VWFEFSDPTGRHADPELSQFALDPDTSPDSVLTCQPNDEFDQLGAHRRSARTTLLPPPAPLVCSRLPVPSEQAVGGDQESAPPVAREQSAEYSEDRPIGRPIANPGVELAFENPHLVTEHHDLDVLVRLRAPGQHDEAEDPTHADVDERERHAGSWPSPYEKCQSRGPHGVLAPFSLDQPRAPGIAWGVVTERVCPRPDASRICTYCAPREGQQ
jgi:hypothetical protein